MLRPRERDGGRSRRERPAKRALTREGIVAVALGVLRREGMARVTMRRIAGELDTGAAALYVYVRDTEDLHAAVLDALLGDVQVPPEGDWRERLHGALAGYRAVLRAYPEIGRMAMSTQPSGANYMALIEALLGLLHEGGVADREAAWAIDLLMLCATAAGVEQGNRMRAPGKMRQELSSLATAIAGADARRYPNVARLGPEILSGSGPDRTEWGVDVLLAGFLGTPRVATDATGEGAGTPEALDAAGVGGARAADGQGER